MPSKKSKKIKCIKFIDDLKYVRKIKAELKKYLPKDLITIVLLGCTDPAEIAHRSAMYQIKCAKIAIYALPQSFSHPPSSSMRERLSNIQIFWERLRQIRIARERKGEIMPLDCLYNEQYDAKVDSIVDWLEDNPRGIRRHPDDPENLLDRYLP